MSIRDCLQDPFDRPRRITEENTSEPQDATADEAGDVADDPEVDDLTLNFRTIKVEASTAEPDGEVAASIAQVDDIAPTSVVMSGGTTMVTGDSSAEGGSAVDAATDVWGDPHVKEGFADQAAVSSTDATFVAEPEGDNILSSLSTFEEVAAPVEDGELDQGIMFETVVDDVIDG